MIHYDTLLMAMRTATANVVTPHERKSPEFGVVLTVVGVVEVMTTMLQGTEV